jgi:hypothetical protein
MDSSRSSKERASTSPTRSSETGAFIQTGAGMGWPRDPWTGRGGYVQAGPAGSFPGLAQERRDALPRDTEALRDLFHRQALGV